MNYSKYDMYIFLKNIGCKCTNLRMVPIVFAFANITVAFKVADLINKMIKERKAILV